MRTDRNDETNSRFSQFFERAQKMGVVKHGDKKSNNKATG